VQQQQQADNQPSKSTQRASQDALDAVGVASMPIDISSKPPPALAEVSAKLIAAGQQQPRLEDLQHERAIRMIRDRSMRELKSSRKAMLSKDYVSVNENASPHRIDAYQEMLYESLDLKIRAAQLLLRLVQNPNTMDYVLRRTDVLNALIGTLKEGFKKSPELTGIILDLFFCFSTFSQLHLLLTEIELGSSTLMVIDFELKRYSRWMDEYSAGVGVAPDKLAVNLQRQERLLFVCFYILLNLAEDPSIEKKLVHANIIPKLLTCLMRENPSSEYLPSLKFLVLTFLKRLSVVHDNQVALLESQLAPYCCELIASASMTASPAMEPIIVTALRTFLNLSFNPEFRDYLISRPNLTALVNTLKVPAISTAAVRVLYILSMDIQRIIEHEQMTAESSSLVYMAQQLAELLANYPSDVVDFELAALAVNLTVYQPAADAIIASPHFPVILDRFKEGQDVGLMKLMQNLAEYPSAKPFLVRLLSYLTATMLQSQSLEARLTSLSILANAVAPHARYSDLFIHFDKLEEVICVNLDVESAEDDVLLQFTMLVGTLATDPNAAKRFAQSKKLIPSIGDVLRNGIEIKDTELVQQALFTLFRLMHHESSRNAICRNMGLLASICEASTMPHRMVRHYANYCLNLAVEFGGKNRDAIIELRFNITHQPFIRFIESGRLNEWTRDTAKLDDQDDAYYDDYDGYEMIGTEGYVPQPSAEFDIDETGLRLRGRNDWQ